MTKYKAYPEYKDSGVEWLGEIPAHWSVKRIKETANVISGYPFSSSQFHSKKGFPLVRIRDINAKRTEVFFDGYVPSEAKINTGDILVGMDGDFNVSWWENGEAALNQRVACIRTTTNALTRFIFYTLPFNMKVVNDLTYFTTVKHLSNTDILKTIFALPSQDEINSIVIFLDHETAKIDNLIEKQQQLIELLKEKRQAVISHAVTKGLSPDMPMKDSSVEWLGEVPAHWSIQKLKYICTTIIAGPFGSSITKDMYVNDGYKVYGQEQVIPNDFNVGDYFISSGDFKKLSRYEVKTGDMLISCVGTFGKIAVFPDWANRGIINPRLIKASLVNWVNPLFVREFLKSETVFKQFELLSRGGTMGVINIAILNEIMTSMPPFEEQNSIVEFIYSQKKKFKELIEKAYNQIGLLQERRTALISAAVTGKIDVRDWVAPDTQETEKIEETAE